VEHMPTRSGPLTCARYVRSCSVIPKRRSWMRWASESLPSAARQRGRNGQEGQCPPSDQGTQSVGHGFVRKLHHVSTRWEEYASEQIISLKRGRPFSVHVSAPAGIVRVVQHKHSGNVSVRFNPPMLRIVQGDMSR